MEHVGDDASLGALAAARDRLPALEEGAELGDEREGPPFVVLRRARLRLIATVEAPEAIRAMLAALGAWRGAPLWTGFQFRQRIP